MGVLTLNHHDAVILKETIEAALNSLRFEISRSDRDAYRELLENRERVLEDLLSNVQRLDQQVVVAATD